MADDAVPCLSVFVAPLPEPPPGVQRAGLNPGAGHTAVY
jgi:hypothetical protein